MVCFCASQTQQQVLTVRFLDPHRASLDLVCEAQADHPDPTDPSWLTTEAIPPLFGAGNNQREWEGLVKFGGR